MPQSPSVRNLRKRAILVSAALIVVYPLIALGFLHEWGDSNKVDLDSNPPLDTPTVKASAPRPVGTEGSYWTPTGLPFTLHVPSSWDGALEGGALILAPSGAASSVSVRFYYAPGGGELADLANRAADFLRQADSSAKLTDRVRARLAGRRALVIGSSSDDVRRWATVLVAGHGSYLIVEQLRRPIVHSLDGQARDLIASLRVNSS